MNINPNSIAQQHSHSEQNLHPSKKIKVSQPSTPPQYTYAQSLNAYNQPNGESYDISNTDMALIKQFLVKKAKEPNSTNSDFKVSSNTFTRSSFKNLASLEMTSNTSLGK